MGLWELALKTTFVGYTQPQGDANYAYASDLSPFNSLTAGKLKCDPPQLGGLYCVSKDNGLSLQLSNFGVSQHMFNIYDGPADEDSNAFLDIKKVDLNGKTIPTWLVSQFNVGIPQASLVDPNNKIPVGNCYIQNAAIAWKQPNGFYYPPTFHSHNLLFHNVDIRHYVIDPQFANMAISSDYEHLRHISDQYRRGSIALLPPSEREHQLLPRVHRDRPADRLDRRRWFADRLGEDRFGE